jgi:hypothetical protein
MSKVGSDLAKKFTTLHQTEKSEPGYRRKNVSGLVMVLASFVVLDLDSLVLLDPDAMKCRVLKSCVLKSGSLSLMLTMYGN